MSSTLAGLLTVLLSESRERRKQFLMSSYMRFNCVGFLLPSRNCSLANVLLCTPTHRRRWIRSVSVSAHALMCFHTHWVGLHKLRCHAVRSNHFVRPGMTRNLFWHHYPLTSKPGKFNSNMHCYYHIYGNITKAMLAGTTITVFEQNASIRMAC